MVNGLKFVLSLVGTVLLVLLCAELALGPGSSTENRLFAGVFIALLALAAWRVRQKSKAK